MRNIFEKFGREDQNPGGGYPPPLGRPKVDFYLGHLRAKQAVHLNVGLLERGEMIQFCGVVTV